MSDFLKPFLFNAHALPAPASEPHVAPGNHVRIAHNPWLGLPVAPFVLEAATPKYRKEINYREAATVIQEIDGKRRTVTLPVTVTPDSPVTIHLPSDPDQTCIWVGLKIDEKPGRDNAGDKPGKPLDPPIIHGGPILAPRIHRIPGIRRIDHGFSPVVRNRLRDRLAERVGTLFSGNETELTVRAAVPTQSGPASVIATRRQAPYNFSGPGITEVYLSGNGVLRYIQWIAGEDDQPLDWQPIALLNLPHPGGRRYVGLRDAEALARKRVAAQAPRRRPLQETTGAPDPAGAPGFSAREEVDRVEHLTSALATHLKSLIEKPTPQILQLWQRAVHDENGKPLANGDGEVSHMTIPRLQLVQQAQPDPGCAALYGYLGLDSRFENNSDALVFYRVTGFFRDLPNDVPDKADGDAADALSALETAIAALPPSRRQLQPRDIVQSMSGFAKSHRLELNPDLLAPGRNYMRFETMAVADRRAPPDAPEPPALLRAEHKSWVPDDPGRARREIRVVVDDTMISGLLAAGRRQPPTGASWAQLNRVIDNSWHLPLVLGSNARDPDTPPDLDPGHGTLMDRNANAPAVRYFVAQSDRFGRWSPFAAINAGPGPRPGPPIPHLLASYTQPSSAAAAATRGGTIHVSVPLPKPEALAPGSHAIDRIRLSLQHFEPDTPAMTTPMPDIEMPVTAATPAVRPNGSDDPERLEIRIEASGPILAVNAARQLVLHGVWIDTAGQLSARSQTVRLKMADPRAPASPAIPETLLYAARPDATNIAWVERRWRVEKNVSHAVYFADEGRLVQHLADSDETAALAAQIRNAPDRLARASLLRANADRFADHLFERLEGVLTEPVAGEAGFRHALPGAARTLGAYKIAAEGAQSGARPDLSSLDLVLYGVPNSDPPPRPVCSARLVEPGATEPDLVVEVTIRVERGVTPPARFRLLRTRSPQADPALMAVVTTNDFGPPDPETGISEAKVRDIGAADIAPTARLLPFCRYAWAAEAQGGPESGSSPPIPGRWSRASDPVTLPLIPDGTPAPFTAATRNGMPHPDGTANLTITLVPTERVAPAALGWWRVRLARGLPNEPMKFLSETDITQDAPITVAGTASAGEIVPAGTRFSAVLIDPAGRSSPALSF